MIGPRGPKKGFKPPNFKTKPNNFKPGPVKGYNPNTFKPVKYPYLPGMYGSQSRKARKDEQVDFGTIMILLMVGISFILLLDRLYVYGIVMGIITGLSLIELIVYKVNKKEPVNTAETEENIASGPEISNKGTTISDEELDLIVGNENFQNYVKSANGEKISKEQLKIMIENHPELVEGLKELI